MNNSAADHQSPVAFVRKYPPRRIGKYVVNPIVRRLIRAGFLGDRMLLLHYAGRKSAHVYATPALYYRYGTELIVFTTRAWAWNFEGGHAATVTWRGSQHSASVRLERDPDSVAAAHHELMADLSARAAQRTLNVRFKLPRKPTLDETRDACARGGISMLQIDLATARPSPS